MQQGYWLRTRSKVLLLIVWASLQTSRIVGLLDRNRPGTRSMILLLCSCVLIHIRLLYMGWEHQGSVVDDGSKVTTAHARMLVRNLGVRSPVPDAVSDRALVSQARVACAV